MQNAHIHDAISGSLLFSRSGSPRPATARCGSASKARAGPGRVTRRKLAGEEVESIEYGRDNPEGLHVDGAGDLWIADTGLGQILRYDGVALTIEGEGLGLPVVITGVDGDSLLANSANLPPQLLSIEILP